MKKLISYIWLLVCNIFIFNFLFAQQEMKYKDVFEIVNTKSEEEAYAILRAYQAQDPFSANTYYQLGVISQKWAKKYDPLTEYSDLKHFVYHANLYLNLALKYIDEKEARKNRNFYQYVKIPEGQKKIELQDVLNDVNERIDDVKIFSDNINIIRKNYLGIVEHYNSCLKIFLEINSKNYKLKDIYLTADNELIDNIKNLRNHLDSTLAYFENYKIAIANFPVKNYHQEYSIIPIETYRLHGLTNSNFLKNEITLWDYNTWVDKVLAVIENDISILRHEIIATAKEMQSIKSVLSITKDYSITYENYQIDEKLIYKIGKFDYKPIILDLLFYNQNKINLIIKSKGQYNNPEFTYNENTDRVKYLNYFHELLEQKLITAELLENLNSSLTSYKLNKYKDFFQENYNGKNGLENYIFKESEDNDKTIDQSFSLLNNYIKRKNKSVYGELKFIEHNNSSIPCFISDITVNDLRPNQYYTADIKKDKNGNKYITGFYNPIEDNKTAFVTKIDSLLNVLWFKQYDFSYAEAKLDNIGVLLALTDNGCISIISSEKKETDSNSDSVSITIINSVVRLTSDGSEILNKNIGPSLIPRYFIFDEINEKMLITYYGQMLNSNQEEMHEMIIDYTDSTGYVLWTNKINFQGNIVDIIKTNENFLFIGNYNKLIDLQGNNIEVPDNNSDNYNSFSALLNNIGFIESIKTYDSGSSYYLTEAVKLNSEVINLLGLKGSYKTRFTNFIQNEKISYKLIDVQGEEIYSY